MTRDNRRPPPALGPDGNDPDREEVEATGHIGTLKKLAPYLWPRGMNNLRLRVIFALLFLLSAKFLTVYLAFFYKDAVDALDGLGNNATMDLVLLAVISYGLARFMAILFQELRDVSFIKVSQHALRNLALKTFRHIHKLSLSFHLERRTGGLSRSIERGTRAIEFLLRFMLFSVLPTLFEILLVTSIFYQHFGAKYAGLLLAGVGGYITLTFLVTDWRIKFRRTMNKEDNAANTKAIDSLLNFETVKYFNNEGHEADRYDRALQGYQQAAQKSQYSLSLLNAAQSMVINASLIGAMLLAAYDVSNGVLTLGDFVLANTLLIQLFIPLNMLGFVYREIKNSLVDMEQLFLLLERTPTIQDVDGAKDLRTTGGALTFKDVKFSYQPERLILKGISFTVPEGKTVAVVGPSGAGKSTISRILFRFYDVDEGVVQIDGQDISHVSQSSLRQSIGMVPQDTVLFNDSIRYNIGYGREGASENEIIEAAKMAQIHDFILSLPDGYDSMVGERGLKLSGGEKQRVAIARTLLKDPAIIVLDEATSALDTALEREIQTSLSEVSKNKTTLVIAHRLSTIVDADEILVLDYGKIVERGKHDDLLSTNGMYASMWKRQREADEIVEKLKQFEQDKIG